MNTQYKLLSVFTVTFCEGNDLADVEENDFNDIPVCDEDALLKAVLCIHGYFF